MLCVQSVVAKVPLDKPLLYSFRRCPYAMRARMALAYAQISVYLREIILRDKPSHLLSMSPKGTVPVLQLIDGTVLEQSLDIMLWALSQHDPDGWLSVDESIREKTFQLIDENDTQFKAALDRYKYSDRYEDVNSLQQRDKAEVFLQKLEACLQQHQFLMADQITLADIAIFPFIRQFASHDPEWFDTLPYCKLQQWLQYHLNSKLFARIMHSYPVWKEGAAEVEFPDE